MLKTSSTTYRKTLSEKYFCKFTLSTSMRINMRRPMQFMLGNEMPQQQPAIQNQISGIQNCFQIPGKCIRYYKDTVSVGDITENENNVKYKLVRNGQGVHQFDPMFYPEYQTIFMANNKLYCVVQDAVYSLDVNQAKMIHQIKDVSQGFCRGCVYNGKLLITDEKSFYILNENDKFEQIQLKFKGWQLETRDTGLCSFGQQALVDCYTSSTYSLYRIQDGGECQLLYVGSRLERMCMQTGVVIYKITYDNSYLVIDITLEEPEIKYSMGMNMGQLHWTKYGYEPEANVLKEMMDDYEGFVQRRDQIWQQQFLNTGNLKKELPPDLDKFGRAFKLGAEERNVFEADYNAVQNRLQVTFVKHAQQMTPTEGNVMEDAMEDVD